MTYTDKVQTAADMLYEAYGERASKMVVDMNWFAQSEGVVFWCDVYNSLLDR